VFNRCLVATAAVADGLFEFVVIVVEELFGHSGIVNRRDASLVDRVDKKTLLHARTMFAGKHPALTLSSTAERQRGETNHANILIQINFERRRNVDNRF
jgi:hypothetical protein